MRKKKKKQNNRQLLKAEKPQQVSLRRIAHQLFKQKSSPCDASYFRAYMGGGK